MLGDVVRGDDDGCTPLCSGTLEDDGTIVTDVHHVPTVAVTHPSPPGAKTPIVASGDDDISSGGTSAVVEVCFARSSDDAVKDQVGAGAGVQGCD